MVNYKTNYRIINKFLKLNHSNTLTLSDIVFAFNFYGVVATYVDNCIGNIGIRSKQQ